MSGPESVYAIASQQAQRRTPAVVVTGETGAAAASAGATRTSTRAKDLLPAGTAPFAQTLAASVTSGSRADAAAIAKDGTWAIPWAEGTAPTQHLIPAGKVRQDQAVVPASSLGIMGRTTAPSMPLRAATPAASAADDPLAVRWPMKGRISQPFGPTTSKYSVPHTVNGVYYEHFHDGIDIAGPVGRAVKTIAAGEVVFTGFYPDGAEVIRVKHADGTIALYAHIDRDRSLKKGDKLAAGTEIGKVGSNGNLTGPHLHLELLSRKGVDLDPLIYLKDRELPGTRSGKLDESVLPASMRNADTSTPGASAVTSTAALQRFDAVASRIPFAEEIRWAAQKAGIDPLLLASLVKAESSFHPKSVSRCGAMGLCQLMPATAKALHVDDPFDPKQNLRAGAKYLANNLRIYGRVDLALAAYQAGKGAVAAAGNRIPDSPTTRHYVNRILNTWAGYMEAAA